MWNTHRRGENMEFCIFARDYKRVRMFRKKCGVRLHIKQRYGLVFILMRYRRSGLAVGAAIFAAVLFIMPQYVWSVNVSGNSKLSTSQIITALDTVGITVGTPLSRVDADNMRLRLALLLPEISWASINIDGTCVNVEVREATARINSDDGFSNLTAMYDGIVTAVYVRSGTATVKVGDAVVKGDLLVSGTEEYNNGVTHFRHSDADIIATVERTVNVTVPIIKSVPRDVSGGHKRTVLTLLGKDIPLYVGGISYPYRAEYRRTPLVIDGVTLPIGTKTATFYEIAHEDIMLTESEAVQEAQRVLADRQAEMFGDFQVLDCEMTVNKSHDAYRITAEYTMSGDIANEEYFEVELQ